MFPGIYEFSWDAGHIIFLGIFYAVLLVVISTMSIATLRAIRRIRRQKLDAVRWHVDFEDLPEKARPCRHELSGEVDHRACENFFDCRHCVDHPRFLAAQKPAPPMEGGVHMVAGFQVPTDRLYHRGHTWVRQDPDGVLTIGLDDLGTHLLGKPDHLELPATGDRLAANGTAWSVTKKGARVRILAPIDGEVIAVGGPHEGWYLKVRPDGDRADTRHLLSAAEARPWMLREVERLQMALAQDGIGASLADGGLPLDDLSTVIPAAQMDDVAGLMFLEP